MAEVEDYVLPLWFEGKQVSEDLLLVSIRKACIYQKLVPVLYASSLGDVGVHELMNDIVDYLPSPLERPPAKGFDRQGGIVQSILRSSEQIPGSSIQSNP